MIGWKIVCCFDIANKEVEVVCEVVGYPTVDESRAWIPVYHDKVIKMAEFSLHEDIKVIERC